jgi:undecaprenyl-phosphate 4-deoxy-4-formamido-L-arabinose transferase
MFGMFVSVAALATYVGVIGYRLFLFDWQGANWHEATSVFWDRDILAFFLIGMLLFGLGLIGEYVGRIYQQVRARPRYMIRAVLERPADPPAGR